jgi:hypothetical protein
MTDLTGKNWMAIGETDDPNAIIESFEAQAAVTKGDPVYLSADNKVSPATAPQNCIGVAVKNAAPSEQCPVLIRGRVKVKAGDAITRGKAVYGAADKSVPLDKDSWTESLLPADGAWSATSGTVSFDTSVKAKGAGSVKTYAQNLNYASCLFTLNAGKGVDTAQYPALNVWLSREAAFNGNVTLTLFDAADRAAGHEFTVGHEKWFQTQVQFDAGADAWQADSGFDWSHIKKVRVTCWFDGAGTGAFWVDGLFFGGRRYSVVAEDAGSQAGYGLRELVEVDEELWSDGECAGRAEALLANQKDPAESLTVRSTVVDYGGSPILAGDKVHIVLPNEGVDANFRVLSAEYNVDAGTQTLETVLELGREAPMLADYVYALRSKTDSRLGSWLC